MNIQLIQGEFSAQDGLDLITQMVQIKIKYHEQKIDISQSEEDQKFRESKIIKLQKELFELRNSLNNSNEKITINAKINIQNP